MKKECVFCGNKIFKAHKTNEHVIPKWLIDETGALNRIGIFGLKYAELEKEEEIL